MSEAKATTPPVHPPTRRAPKTGEPLGSETATFTARAARWSAAHRRTAVLGWLALVFIVYAIASAVGTVTLKSEDQGVGESRAANRVLAREFPRVRAPE